MGLKSIFRKIYYWGLNPEPEFQRLQKIIRDVEWEAISGHIPQGASFLDVGCGTGYSMYRAYTDKGCDVHGIDPVVNYAGVKLQDEQLNVLMDRVVEGSAENLPYPDSTFDVVYSSHVLEHTQDEQAALREMNRVLRPGGTLILGVPTATMSLIRLFSILLFDTHRRIFALLTWPFRPELRKRLRLIDLVVPPSHGQPHRTIFFDLVHYRTQNWQRIVSGSFRIEKTIYPALYPFPDYIQLFKLRKMKSFGSSVFFIATPLHRSDTGL